MSSPCTLKKDIEELIKMQRRKQLRWRVYGTFAMWRLARCQVTVRNPPPLHPINCPPLISVVAGGKREGKDIEKELWHNLGANPGSDVTGCCDTLGISSVSRDLWECCVWGGVLYHSWVFFWEWCHKVGNGVFQPPESPWVLSVMGWQPSYEEGERLLKGFKVEAYNIYAWGKESG